MEFVQQLAIAAGIPAATAPGLAGALLGKVQSSVASASPEAAAQVDKAIPELAQWKQAAAEVPEAAPEGGVMGTLQQAAGSGLFGAAAKSLGGDKAQGFAELAGVLGRFGIDGKQAAAVAPVIQGFLQARLSGDTLSTVLSVVPFLSGTGAPDSTSAASTISGWLAR